MSTNLCTIIIYSMFVYVTTIKNAFYVIS
jgi:hypothetical protein